MHIIVVGLGYGDEGKGATVDAEARRLKAVANIRFSGGSNPAHHIELPSGRVHCFRQFGSGMIMADVITYASEYMLIDPLSLLAEAEFHESKGVTKMMSRIFIHGESLVITPLHLRMNQFRELVRADGRHGSVGKGVGEAFADSIISSEEVLRIKDLSQSKIMRRKLKCLQDTKVVAAKMLLADCPDDKILKIALDCLARKGYVADMVREYQEFSRLITVVDENFGFRLFNDSKPLIFEGTQGALLDPVHGFVPHVTKTRVTIDNALSLTANTSIEKKIIGVLRAYSTRHGAGPFVTENIGLDGKLFDKNNDANAWQGKFRFGWFDLVAARYAINVANNGMIDELSITCMDAFDVLTEIKVCTSYEYLGDNQKQLSQYFDWDINAGRIRIKSIKPVINQQSQMERTELLKQCVPLDFKIFKGRNTLSEINYKKSRLSGQAREYIEYLESKEGLGLPISIVSSGPTWLDRTYR